MSKSTAEIDVAHGIMLLDLARKGDRDAFQRLAEPYRRELQLHCYRMLASLQDAEDLVQETFLRAWRGIDGFDGRASLRSWLYRIATNACLNALAKRASARRALPETQGPPTVKMPEGAPPTENVWLEPYPDALLEGIADTAPGPDAHYELHEAVQLAFIAAIQHLPPRQRAVLLLRDVLGWPAADTAGLLDTSVASANSALQRARATLEKQFPSGQPAALPEPDDEQRELLARYVRAWEDADIDGFVALLRDDATLSMPPWPNWYRGHEAIQAFLRWVWATDACGSSRTQHSNRLIPTAANRQPAFAAYRRDPQTSGWRAHAIHLPTFRGDTLAAITCFVVPVGPRLFAAFGLPDVLPPEDTALPVLRA
ncbi:MAG: sigma-70 family RNA polymerase sigma factor [Ktedonobacterales bacterium]